MSEEPTRANPGVLRWLCWLPLAALFGVELYVSNFDGWGAWASAPLLLVPGLMSFTLVLMGGIEIFAAIRAGVSPASALFFTFIASLPICWLGVRRFFL
jgi:hypothetical protein